MYIKTFKQVLLLILTSVILYFSGIYLLDSGKVKSLTQGLVVIAFFLSFFPFVSMTLILISKFVKGLTKIV